MLSRYSSNSRLLGTPNAGFSGQTASKFLLPQLNSVFGSHKRLFATFTDDPYDVLGVSRLADDKELKRAFYKKAKKYHPDLNRSSNPEMFKKVAWAYELLTDPQRRGNYDTFGFDTNQQNKKATHDMKYTHAEELFMRVFQELGVNDYVKEVTSDFKTSLHAARHGDYSLIKDFAKERKILIGGLFLPFVILARFPGMASVLGRALIVSSVAILNTVPPHVAFSMLKRFFKR